MLNSLCKWQNKYIHKMKFKKNSVHLVLVDFEPDSETVENCNIIKNTWLKSSIDH